MTESVRELLTSVFHREGFPGKIISDHGPQFESYEISTFLSERDIKHSHSDTYQPEGNGEIKGFNKVLNESLQTAKIHTIQ